jgi:hypothetical protein
MDGNEFVKLNDAVGCVMNAMFNEEANKVYEQKGSADFKSGALFGMSWALSSIWGNCRKYTMNHAVKDE